MNELAVAVLHLAPLLGGLLVWRAAGRRAETIGLAAVGLAAVAGLALAAEVLRDGRLVVRPRGLLPDAVYDVRSLDVGPLGASGGDLLMQDGIELIHTGGSSRAHVLILNAR